MMGVLHSEFKPTMRMRKQIICDILLDVTCVSKLLRAIYMALSLSLSLSSHGKNDYTDRSANNRFD